MEQWTEIRRRVLVEGVRKREILRETGMHWSTLEKILRHSAPPGYRLQKDRPKPKVGPHLERITQILEADNVLHDYLLAQQPPSFYATSILKGIPNT